MSTIWDQLAFIGPHLKSSTDIEIYCAHRESTCLVQFFMALDDRFEHTRASLLSRQPLPIVDQPLTELIAIETRKATSESSSIDVVLAASSRPTPTGSFRVECRYCHHLGHHIF